MIHKLLGFPVEIFFVNKQLSQACSFLVENEAVTQNQFDLVIPSLLRQALVTNFISGKR